MFRLYALCRCCAVPCLCSCFCFCFRFCFTSFPVYRLLALFNGCPHLSEQVSRLGIYHSCFGCFHCRNSACLSLFPFPLLPFHVHQSYTRCALPLLSPSFSLLFISVHLLDCVNHRHHLYWVECMLGRSVRRWDARALGVKMS